MSRPTLAMNQRRASPLERLLRGRLLLAFEQLEDCRLSILDPEGDWSVGTEQAELIATVQVHDPAFYRHLALGGSVGAGEAYIEGFWDCDDLTTLFRLFVRNRDVLDGLETGFARLSASLLRLLHARNRNTRRGSQRNIAAHYDLGNDFFELFLDQSMMYSSAVYRTGQETLEAAQFEKLDRICRKLQLTPQTQVLEIGTGWGGFALHAATHYGARVTTTTISREQAEQAKQQVAAAGLGNQITVLTEDYRDLSGQYDRLVSIEMIEAVGHQYLDGYLGQVGALLKPDGMALIQAITIEDHRYQRALGDIDFIKRFVFPGSFIPSVSAILGAAARSSDLRLFHLEDIGPSYALTLREWRRRFEQQRDAILALGYPKPFLRLWRFYLAYCEAGFLERSVGNAQLLLTRPRCQRAQLLPIHDPLPATAST